MPRRARILVDGGYYHILTRGNDRRKLFRYKSDYRYFIDILKKYLTKSSLSILNYCIMPNHIHLLIHAKIAQELPKFMQGVLQVYADCFRKKYNSTGFVFQNRYKSLLIEKDSYLLECGRYIERNPLRAEIVQNLSDYEFSSYLFYVDGLRDRLITVVNPLYLELAQTDAERRKLYKNYVLGQRAYELIVDQALRIG